jgi:hypothetical protein
VNGIGVGQPRTNTLRGPRPVRGRIFSISSLPSIPTGRPWRGLGIPGHWPRNCESGERGTWPIPTRSARAIWLSPRTARSRRSPRANRSLGGAQ